MSEVSERYPKSLGDLHWLLRAHVVPFAVLQGGEVMEVTDVACLLAGELGVAREIDVHDFRSWTE